VRRSRTDGDAAKVEGRHSSATLGKGRQKFPRTQLMAVLDHASVKTNDVHESSDPLLSLTKGGRSSKVTGPAVYRSIGCSIASRIGSGCETLSRTKIVG
jgi:hypothetical protein